MMKDVIIKITGMQGIEDQDDTIELTTVGRLGFRKGSILLSYEEGEMMGVNGVKTTLHIKDDNTVILQRSGAIASKLVVQKGVRNNCFYNTPQGEIMIGIFGENIRHNLTSEGGHLEMSYTIDSNLNLISRNKVEITVREVENNVNTRS